MGLGTVVVFSAMMKQSWNARHDHQLIVEMCQVNGGLLVLFAGLRFADLLSAGKLELLAVPDFFLIVFVLEMALFLVPAVVFLSGRVENARARFVAALSAVAAGALWRVDAFLTCYNGGEGFQYWPSWGEIAVTVGMAAIGVAVFIAITRLLPVVVVHDTPVPASIAAFVLSAKPGEDPGRPGALAPHS
jgi:Ni/Fe-hydrogenase subunit HybB-like protein